MAADEDKGKTGSGLAGLPLGGKDAWIDDEGEPAPTETAVAVGTLQPVHSFGTCHMGITG